ncbi:hypothetical protein AAFF_G00393510 [Aldrovandia affinis]|uniref:Uncharacterized protein n=1 Tax=Aldrovandia affinis TaxID=143900 RepID=A0AAD7SE26_9TELE|nr:hypothetical protein AAFF_G00393510 [Aldrovandia affinis]
MIAPHASSVPFEYAGTPSSFSRAASPTTTVTRSSDWLTLLSVGVYLLSQCRVHMGGGVHCSWRFSRFDLHHLAARSVRRRVGCCFASPVRPVRKEELREQALLSLRHGQVCTRERTGPTRDDCWGCTVVSKASMAFCRHLWFLSEHLIARAFFDDRVTMETKEKMVGNLQCPRLPGPPRRLEITDEVEHLKL